MPRKCVVYGCRSGYASEKNASKLSFYRFPKDHQRLQEWLSSLPNRFPVGFQPSVHQVICSLHWPDNFEKTSCRGNKNGIPKYPPSIFPNIPPSCVPSSSCSISGDSRRRRAAASNLFAEHRSIKEDELPLFREIDRLPALLSVSDLCSRFPNLVVFEDSLQNLVLLSKERIGPIYSFQVTLSKEGILRSCYLKTSLITIPFLERSKLLFWSTLEAVLNHLTVTKNDRPSSIFIENEIARTNRKKVGERKYTNDDLLFAFELLSRSRSAYAFMSRYMSLPSERLLRHITSGVNAVEDIRYLKTIIDSLPAQKRACVVQIDEVYLRVETNYRNGSFFGFADDGRPARTLLYFLLKFEMGGPIIPYKYYPIFTLNATTMFSYYKEIRNTVLESGSQILAVVTDNCRVNQRFLEMIENDFRNEELPLNDTVHLLKCLRNNWYIRNNLRFIDPDDRSVRFAKWSTLKAIYDEECGSLLKKSDLNMKSVAPKNVEKQSVPLALKVFSEKTQAAAHAKDHDSARFIEICCRFFRICNNRSVHRDKHLLCPDRKEIRDVSQLDWLVLF